LANLKKLLYVCEADSGGIMEYAIRQSAAIVREGVELHFLCSESFPTERLARGILKLKFHAVNPPFWAVAKFPTMWRLAFGQRIKSKQVCKIFREGDFDAVLFACYKEYFSPFWAGPLKKLARKGAVIGTIAHDPIRDFVVGPLWWHRWSVRQGYSFVRHVFVHDETPVDFGGKKPKKIEVHQIPHGPYEVAEPKIGRLEMRRRLGFSSDLTTEDTESTEDAVGPCLNNPSGVSDSLASSLADMLVSESHTRSASRASLPVTSHSPLATPALPDVVFLAFGQIRDGKNLDLFLRAMTHLPENAKLLVAGKGESGSSRPVEYYQKLSEELGIAERCRWDIRKIPEEEVGDFFAACDVVLVTYSAQFRSASGVLNSAVSARKPVLASSGAGPLRKMVEKYQLGLFVEPDNEAEIIRGALKYLPNDFTGKSELRLNPTWVIYEKKNSWAENGKILNKIMCTHL
jgi:glycosyltransferase involved in cell wall biosynthesis